jgi:VWFA-related protein
MMLRLCRALGFAAACLSIATLSAQQDSRRYVERVEVSRILVDARVMDGKGTPLTGLGVDDFAVRVGGKPARVETVEWLSRDAPDADLATLPANSLRGIVEPPDGTLTVLLLQKSFEGSRMTGLMRLLLGTREFLDQFGSRDRIAVLSFDYHLEIWLDFTKDRERVRQVLDQVLVDPPPALEPVPSPSLLEHISVNRARETYSIEQSLRLIGDAVADVPGAKSIVLIGYGFGRLNPTTGSVHMENGYAEARRALQAARASVFCLDVTDADYHSLEAGLQLVSAATGGFFARTHLFQNRAFNMLSGALAGHYVLFVERPDLVRGTHPIDVKLTRRKGTVLARDSWSDD